jgi:hypothetical protein
MNLLDSIKFPRTEDDCRSEAVAFQRLHSSPFGGIIAAMDGIAITITCPRLSCCPDPRKYFNRKGVFAISVQACVTASYKVSFVSAMHVGSRHDSTAFLSSSLHAHLLKKEEDGGLPSWACVAADNAYGNGAAGGRVLTICWKPDEAPGLLQLLLVFSTNPRRASVRCNCWSLWRAVVANEMHPCQGCQDCCSMLQTTELYYRGAIPPRRRQHRPQRRGACRVGPGQQSPRRAKRLFAGRPAPRAGSRAPRQARERGLKREYC